MRPRQSSALHLGGGTLLRPDTKFFSFSDTVARSHGIHSRALVASERTPSPKIMRGLGRQGVVGEGLDPFGLHVDDAGDVL